MSNLVVLTLQLRQLAFVALSANQLLRARDQGRRFCQVIAVATAGPDGALVAPRDLKNSELRAKLSPLLPELVRRWADGETLIKAF